MDGLLWFLSQLALLLALAALVFFTMGYRVGGRGLRQRIRELEARVDEEDRGRRLALEARDALKSELHQPGQTTVSPAEWEEAQQQQRALEREVLRLSDELKACRTVPTELVESEPEVEARQPALKLHVDAGDDLTKIKGIGAVIAKKLNGAGIQTYAQIAAWTEEEVQDFSERLAFKGRVQRDRWREQARELAG